MDMNRRAVLHMLVRRLGDGDKAQYIPHFAEAREITVGEYQEFMEDGIRKLDILRDMGGARIPAGPGVDYVSGGPSPLLPSLLSAAVSPVATPAAGIVGRLDKSLLNRNMYMDWTSHLLGRSDK
jgi:hypothetical protein